MHPFDLIMWTAFIGVLLFSVAIFIRSLFAPLPLPRAWRRIPRDSLTDRLRITCIHCGQLLSDSKPIDPPVSDYGIDAHSVCDDCKKFDVGNRLSAIGYCSDAWPIPSRVRTICMDCYAWISGPTSTDPGTIISHGLCKKCLPARLREVEAIKASASSLPSLPSVQNSLSAPDPVTTPITSHSSSQPAVVDAMPDDSPKRARPCDPAQTHHPERPLSFPLAAH